MVPAQPAGHWHVHELASNVSPGPQAPAPGPQAAGAAAPSAAWKRLGTTSVPLSTAKPRSRSSETAAGGNTDLAAASWPSAAEPLNAEQYPRAYSQRSPA